MLAGIYYGAMYGGSTTSILLNVPGEGTSMITCLDGYPMAKAGRAGPALGISAFGSFIAGTFSDHHADDPWPRFGQCGHKVWPPGVCGPHLSWAHPGHLSGERIDGQGTHDGRLWTLIGCMGLDLVAGTERYTFGLMRLKDGIGLIPIMMGLFGVAEVFLTIETSLKKADIFKTSAKELLPTKQDWKDSTGPIARGTLSGFFLGIIPGGGGLLGLPDVLRH